MDEELFERIKSFVEEFWPSDNMKLHPYTSVQKDLGIGGSDGIDFMVAYSETFQVDMSEFYSIRYFGPECEPILYSLYCLLFARNRLKMTPITLYDLTMAAKAKKWPRHEAISDI